MDHRTTVAVAVPHIGDERRKNWAKIVDNVDPDKTGGWAYEGMFVATGGIQDLPAPSVLLVYGERGSQSNPQIEARVYTVNTDATLSHRHSATGRAWARTLRDHVAEMLGTDHPAPTQSRAWDEDLMTYSTEALNAELSRRAEDGPAA